jgi:hypothetical protein
MLEQGPDGAKGGRNGSNRRLNRDNPDPSHSVILSATKDLCTLFAVHRGDPLDSCDSIASLHTVFAGEKNARFGIGSMKTRGLLAYSR